MTAEIREPITVVHADSARPQSLWVAFGRAER